MPLGQIVYDLEDYGGSGGLVSTRKGESAKFSIINSFDNEKYNEQKVQITQELLEQVGVRKITKLGIQAPPGTKFFINKNSDFLIMVGRTGVYEIEDGPSIESLQFVQPNEFTLDTYETQQRINLGLKGMRDAKNNFDKRLLSIQTLGEASNDSDSLKKYYEKYDEYHAEYVEKYDNAKGMYIQGLSGVYKKSPSIQRLKNIIIDFIYDEID